MISELKPCAFPFAGKWMWHWASLSTLLSLSLALISDANLWDENNKGNRRILTCRYCGCYWSIYSEEDGKWDVFHLRIHHDSIFTNLPLTSSSSLLCAWKPALCGTAERRVKRELLCWMSGCYFSADFFFLGCRGFGHAPLRKGYSCFPLDLGVSAWKQDTIWRDIPEWCN